MSDEYIAEIEHRVAGIPCLIGVLSFDHQPGSYSFWADSDYDYYGYCEIDWDVLDRRGRPAPWLVRKLTDKMRDDIEAAIREHMLDTSTQSVWD